jgi:hypothetical protein
VDGDHALGGLADALLCAQLHGSDDEGFAVGLDLERGVLGDVEQVEDRAIDDEPEAGFNCSELLDHGRLACSSDVRTSP